jgi:hypothetical protein
LVSCSVHNKSIGNICQRNIVGKLIGKELQFKSLQEGPQREKSKYPAVRSNHLRKPGKAKKQQFVFSATKVVLSH